MQSPIVSHSNAHSVNSYSVLRYRILKYLRPGSEEMVVRGLVSCPGIYGGRTTRKFHSWRLTRKRLEVFGGPRRLRLASMDILLHVLFL